MNVGLLRITDRFVGLPLCWLLTCFRYGFRPVARRHPLPSPRKVLIIKMSEMGSSVLACPAIRALQRQVPGAEIYFLVFAQNRAILDAMNVTGADHIVSVDADHPFRLLSSGWRAVWRLRRAGLDTTIDMDLFSRFSAILAFLVCRGNRVGFHRYADEGLDRGNLLTHRVLYSPHVHTSVAFLALVRSLFCRNGEEPLLREKIESDLADVPLHKPRESAVASVEQKLRQAGLLLKEKRKLVLINPNSSEIFPLRKWPIDRYAELCSLILRDMPDVGVVVTGVRSEIGDATFITAKVQNPRCVSLAGETSFEELLALYSVAHVLVTNDSGPAHFASLLRLQSIVLFGPETPRLYSPLGDTCRCLHAGFACSPCVSVYNAKKSLCTDNRCLKAISVEEVMTEVRQALSQVTLGRNGEGSLAPSPGRI